MTSETYSIRAIETRYAGCLFRSRLEARWARFFDDLDIRWEYEPQGFDLPSGRRYLPDFWLPETNSWFEVKGATPTKSEQADLREFASLLPRSGDGSVGQPTSLQQLSENQYLKVKVGDIPRPDKSELDWDRFIDPSQPLEPFGQGAIWRVIGDLAPRPRYWCRCPAGHMWVGWGWCWVCMLSNRDSDYMAAWAIGTHPQVKAAYIAARSARFEHGENG